ncbi:MAG: protein kinase [Planctomycetes bacterium]|nr:protein kinase [Planctomycetota bacterium]
MTFAQPFTDYEILDRVGAGAMGTVFKARHKRLNRIVALKVLKPSLARDGRYVDRLRREARIVASLNHPNIVTGYDLGEEGGYHFFVMEFVEGKSLRALLVEWGMFAEEYVRRVARQVAQALDHAYQRGVIHRDIKPGNILIDERGEVKLTDMGLAKGPADLTLTRDGATVGTPQYISPEQARNPQDVDVRSDLYSLGATLYHMATGVPPFRGDTMAQLITKVLNEAPTPPNEVNPALSEGLSLVVRKLLAKDLRVRYQTPGELLDDLDRVEQSLPPAVDVSRLDADEGSRFGAWWKFGGVLLVAGLLGLALWIGMQLRDDAPAPPTAEEFLARLDAELATQPSPAARLRVLRVPTTPPPGCEAELLQRERRVAAELQAAFDGVAAALQGADWPDLAGWLRDPLVWPDRARVERERVQPRLAAATGIAPGQVPPQVRTLRLDELLGRIERELVERDQELLRRFELHLTSPLPARADERVRAGDFVTAERLWRDAVPGFFDGVRQPLPERLAAATAQRMGDLYERARRGAVAAIDAAETAVTAAFVAEVEEVAGSLAERLRDGEPADLVAASLQQFRQDLQQVWPPHGQFRSGRDPWPDAERRLGVVQQAVAAAVVREAAQRFERRCDLAWRTFCHGGATDALAVLAGAAPTTPQQAERQQRHAQALAAAHAVELAVVRTIARSTTPVVAFPRSGPVQAVELRAEATADGGLRLVSQRVGQPPRAARLGEFRFSDLLAWLRQQGLDPLRDVPAAQRLLGSVTVALAGDDLNGIGARLAELEADGDRFLGDDVWPRIVAVRGEDPEGEVDRASLLAGLRRAREAAAAAGSLNELEAAILTFQARVSTAEMADQERHELRAAQQWLRLERRRRDLLDELRGAAPAGAEARVVIAGDQLDVEVAFGGGALLRGAAEGWQQRQGALEFAGGERPWPELPQQLLRCTTGLDGSAVRAQAELDLVLPPAAVGRRLYVVEFRGIAVLLTVSANDVAYAALVDGDPRREELAQRAFTRAMQGALQPARALVVPGGVHRLRIDVTASVTRRRATVAVDLDGAVLIDRELHELQASQPLDVVVLPQQEIALRRVAVRALGL